MPTLKLPSLTTTPLPAAVEAEQFILGGLLTGASFVDVKDLLSTPDFTAAPHRHVWRAMSALYDSGREIDSKGVYFELVARSKAEACGGLTGIIDLAIPVVNIEPFVRLVREKAALRRIITHADSMISKCLLQQDDPTDIIAEGEKVFRDLDAGQQDTEGMQNFTAVLEECGGLDSFGREPAPGIPLAWPELRRKIGSFHPGELIIIAARPSSGKSAMIQQQGLYAAERGHGIAFFSLEMSARSLLSRAVADRGNIDSTDIQRGRMSDLDRAAMRTAMNQLADLPFYMEVKSRSFSAIHAKTRRLMAKHPIAAVCVDHLHLMSETGSHRNENRNQELGRITSEFKLMAKELNVPVILLAQLSRAHEKENRAPEMRDLRDSGELEANADVIIFLHPKEKMEASGRKAPCQPVDLLIVKQREGERFMRIPMLLWGKYSRFVEAEEGRDEDQ